MPTPQTLKPPVNKAPRRSRTYQNLTAGYLFIDIEQQTASYAGAGHPPLLLWRQQEKDVLEIRQKGIILGQVEETSYKHSDLKLQKSDRFVLYTDGIVEALNPAGEIYGADRLKAFIEANSGLAAEQFCDRLVDTMAGWSGGGLKTSLDDDLTLVVVDFETAAT
jgi:serine phosphatase RsbU (regulator of sigma subunit)